LKFNFIWLAQYPFGVKASTPARANGGGVDFDQLLVVGQLAERRWDSNFLCHKLILTLWW
jgi:hypothetical protein